MLVAFACIILVLEDALYNLATIGAAGYLHMIHQMKELIMGAGKKAYTLVMGRPNPAKLANFPEVISKTCS